MMISQIALKFLLQVQDSAMQVDTTSIGYKVGIYIGSFLPFIGLLIVFLIIIRSSYRFGNKKK
jgi:hypothetical protein